MNIKEKVAGVLKMFVWLGIVLAGLYGAYLGILKIKALKEGGREDILMRSFVEKQADITANEIFNKTIDLQPEPTKAQNNSLIRINADSGYLLHPPKQGQ